ncbi:MAG: SixA phosphatase family protein [Myxococcota bacterium]
MRDLYLLRHAKSDWGDDRQDDHDRPLAPRGERACAAVGPELGRGSPPPRLALCSSARRAVDTLERVLAHLTPTPPLRIENDLYLASTSQLFEALAGLDDALDAVLMVGHNPGLQAFALDLAGEGDRDAYDRLRHKLPTAGLVHLRFPAERWRDVGPGSGRLVRFVTPKELAAR